MKTEESCEEIGKEWERKAENWGKRMEKKWDKKGDEIGKKVSKPAEYIVTIIINFVMIWVFGHLQQWLPFLTDSWSKVLPLFYISLYATIVANFIFLIANNNVIKAILKVLLNIWGIIVMVNVYRVFPFDFSAYSFNWAQLVRILLIVGVFGTAIGTIFEFANTVSGKKDR